MQIHHIGGVTFTKKLKSLIELNKIIMIKDNSREHPNYSFSLWLLSFLLISSKCVINEEGIICQYQKLILNIRFSIYGNSNKSHFFEVTGLVYDNLYYYIKQLRIGGSIFCHDIFLLYPFYPSIRRIISIFGWSNVCNRVHWSPLSLYFPHLYYYFHLCIWFTN
jgi:hypothetical protein